MKKFLNIQTKKLQIKAPVPAFKRAKEKKN